MIATRVSLLTPTGSAAIAVLAVRGPRAWDIVSRHFRPHRQVNNLGSYPNVRFGRFGESVVDEVIVIIRKPDDVEIHCHGGRQVIAWLMGVLSLESVEEVPWTELASGQFADSEAAALLPFARTMRTSSILLDQAHGAYLHAAEDEGTRELLLRNVRVGRHLIEPWIVAIAGKPNAGKSTLMNALAGFDRSVVSPIPGTTRDAVSVVLAFDGWPVNLIDTAGLRESADLLEEEGVQRAKDALASSDICLWVVDASEEPAPSLNQVAELVNRSPGSIVTVLNKADLVPDLGTPADTVRVSASTREGIPALAELIARRLVPHPPEPGEPVPFTPDRCERWS